MVVTRAVGRIPDVYQGHSRMEPVKDAERLDGIAQDDPQIRTVELFSQFIRFSSGFRRDGGPGVQRQIGHDEERQRIFPSSFNLVLLLV